jgi:hypothetical protein
LALKVLASATHARRKIFRKLRDNPPKNFSMLIRRNILKVAGPPRPLMQCGQFGGAMRLQRRKVLKLGRCYITPVLNFLLRCSIFSPIARQIETLQSAPSEQTAAIKGIPSEKAGDLVDRNSTIENKIALFRRLFRGRSDVFPVRWENRKTGRSGYAPACANEWRRGICEKPKVKCSACPNQAFFAVDDVSIERHLRWTDAKESPFIMGV